MLPFLKGLETELDFGATDVHGAEGPMPVKRPDSERVVPVTSAFVEACLDLGFRWALISTDGIQVELAFCR